MIEIIPKPEARHGDARAGVELVDTSHTRQSNQAAGLMGLRVICVKLKCWLVASRAWCRRAVVSAVKSLAFLSGR